jgi:hypothetical protein
VRQVGNQWFLADERGAGADKRSCRRRGSVNCCGRHSHRIARDRRRIRRLCACRASRFRGAVIFGGRPMCWPRNLAWARPSPVRVRIKSRSTSASPPSTAIISRPLLVEVSAHGSARLRNCPPASMIFLTMANSSNTDRASRSSLVTRSRPPRVESLP